jgi:serine/threonine-protein kinase HipA
MSRFPQHKPLKVLLNNELVGHLYKDPSGAIYFRYNEKWLSKTSAIPVSLSLPLREDVYKGAPVVAVFENLLPDSDELRQRVAEKVGAQGTDAYSLLSQIGRDCVGALQFLPDDQIVNEDTSKINGEEIHEHEIEKLLNNLVRAPLGLDRDQDFRISVAGAQEKTALLLYNGMWFKPHGTTPTTHLFKTQIGSLPNGMDLSNSVENEFYCLKLLAAFGLPVNKAEIKTFGKTKALVIERFDRAWTKENRILRVPQEDFCQILSCPPSKKYQNSGGPGMVDILNRLKGADMPREDQKMFLKAQILFWLIGATDGHAKNFSIFLGRGGTFHLAPFYDVLTCQPSIDSRQIERKQMKLAMSVGQNRHYRIDEIEGRHFVQTAEMADLPADLASDTLREVVREAEKAINLVEAELPADFPREIHSSVKDGMALRLPKMWN